MKKKAIICDLDGTLLDCEHRRHFVECEKKDWANFLHPDHIKKDKFNDWCKELILAMHKHDHTILFVTGRNENVRNVTIETLLKEWHQENIILHMRKDEDFRSDSVIKKEIYDEFIEPFYDVIFSVDDRKSVVQMWRDIGLVCLQCAEGNF